MLADITSNTEDWNDEKYLTTGVRQVDLNEWGDSEKYHTPNGMSMYGKYNSSALPSSGMHGHSIYF